MIRSLTALLVFFLFLLPLAAQPKASIDALEHDFGRIREGRKVTHTFTVKNEGAAALAIENVLPTCGCTTSSFDREIAPGQTGKITLVVNPLGIGKFTKYAYVETNDPQQQKLTLTLQYETFIPKGYRLGAFLLDPGNEIEGTASAGQSMETKIGIYCDQVAPLQLSLLTTESKIFELVLVPADAGTRYILQAKSLPTLAAGTHVQKVQLKTNVPAQEKLELTLRVTVSAPAGSASPTTRAASAKKKTAPAKRK